MILKFTIECCKYFSMTKNNTINQILGVYIMIIGPILTLTGITLSLFATDEIRYLTQIVGFAFCFIFGYAIQIFFVVHRKLLKRIINRVLGVHFSYPHFIRVDKNITRIAERRAEEKSKLEILVYVLTSSLWVLCPYLYLITKPDIGFDHPDVQVIPYYYQIWRTRSIFSFVAKKCVEVIISSAGLLAYYIFTIFITYTITNLEFHAEEINRRLNGVIEGHVRKYMRFNELSISPIQKCGCFVFEHVNQKRRKRYEKSFKEEFVRIITYHNFIHCYTADVTKLLHKPITAVFAWYVSATILFTYTLKVSSGDGIYFMKMLCLVIHTNVSLHLFCSMAEIIYQMNEKIMNSFYNTSWYHLLPKSRKNFSIILALCQRKHKVKCFGMYIVNLNLFILAARMVYSVMNVVLMVQNKNTKRT